MTVSIQESAHQPDQPALLFYIQRFAVTLLSIILYYQRNILGLCLELQITLGLGGAAGGSNTTALFIARFSKRYVGYDFFRYLGHVGGHY